MDWNAVRDEFICDGSLRDLYVLGTAEMDWQKLLDAIPSWSYPTRYLVGGIDAPLPTSISDVFALRSAQTVLLSLRVGVGDLNCHFFSEDEIELDLDPRFVSSQAELDQLLGFMRHVGRALQRSVLLTPENSPNGPFLTYSPNADSFAHSRAASKDVRAG